MSQRRSSISVLPDRRRYIRRVLNVLLAVAAGTAVGSLVLLHGGFDLQAFPLSRASLVTLQKVIVGYFICDRLLRIVLARNKRDYLRNNWVDPVLIVVFAVALLITARLGRPVVQAGTIYLVIFQGYLLAAVIVRLINANLQLAESGLPPSWLLIGSFGGLCLLGSALLMLPAAVRPENYAHWYYPDALFTAISATCVTGLVVVDTGTHFTLFGQAVILVMIQLGGLGIMIFGTMMALLAGKGLSFRGSEALGEMLASDRIGQIGRTVRFIALTTILCEAIGTAMLLPMFRDPAVRDGFGRSIGPVDAVWHAVFHSVSAFCNAGFALYGDSLRHGSDAGWPSPLRDHWQVLGVFAPLIILGGLGFPVLQDVLGVLRQNARRFWRRLRPSAGRRPQPREKLNLHSRVVLSLSAGLIVLGAIGVAVLETSISRGPTVGGRREETGVVNSEWSELSAGEKIRDALFQSITARTAGFNTLDMARMSDGGKFWLCALMSIGGSPASTAGGMKTATFAALMFAGWSVLRRRGETEVFHRSIPDDILRRAITLAMLYLGLLVTTTLLLCLTMRGERLADLLFEACSACGTVGLSTGVTPRLTTTGKYIVMAGMFIGRLGPLTLILALTVRLKPARYAYSREPLVLG